MLIFSIIAISLILVIILSPFLQSKIFCVWMKQHYYQEATINDDGNWQTVCSKCGSTLVLKGRKWEEVSKNQ